jgi:hypothetical protein
MSSKTHSYILAVIITIVAGVGMMSTGIAAMATTNDQNTNTNTSSQSAYTNTNSNDNENRNSNNNNISIGAGQQLAQIPQYQYQQPAVPPYYPPPVFTPPAPAYDYYQPAPGMPNAGFGDMSKGALALLFGSGILFFAGLAYLFSWSKQNVKYS